MLVLRSAQIVPTSGACVLAIGDLSDVMQVTTDAPMKGKIS
jgi:hypothetical protein